MQALPLGAQTPFTPGNLAVLRVGTGSAALGSGSTAVFLDEYSLTGTLVQSVALPNTGTGNKLTSSGSATSEGIITRSANGQYIAIAGYNSVTGTASIANSSSATVGRTIAFIKYDGTVNVPYSLSNFSTGNNPRSAYTLDGVNAYIVGGATALLMPLLLQLPLPLR